MSKNVTIVYKSGEEYVEFECNNCTNKMSKTALIGVYFCNFCSNPIFISGADIKSARVVFEQKKEENSIWL